MGDSGQQALGPEAFARGFIGAILEPAFVASQVDLAIDESGKRNNGPTVLYGFISYTAQLGRTQGAAPGGSGPGVRLALPVTVALQAMVPPIWPPFIPVPLVAALPPGAVLDYRVDAVATLRLSAVPEAPLGLRLSFATLTAADVASTITVLSGPPATAALSGIFQGQVVAKLVDQLNEALAPDRHVDLLARIQAGLWATGDLAPVLAPQAPPHPWESTLQAVHRGPLFLGAGNARVVQSDYGPQVFVDWVIRNVSPDPLFLGGSCFDPLPASVPVPGNLPTFFWLMPGMVCAGSVNQFASGAGAIQELQVGYSLRRGESQLFQRTLAVAHPG